MKHVKLFGGFNPQLNETFGFDLPEGMMLRIVKNNKKDLIKYYEEEGVEDWSGLSLQEWLASLDQMGDIEYADGKQYYRGVIEWPSMGVKYMYELHPF